MNLTARRCPISTVQSTIVLGDHMQPISRRAFAVTIGIVVGMVANMAIAQLGMSIHPPPQGFDPNDASAMSAWVSTMSTSQLLFPFVAHIAQGLVGSLAGCYANRDTALRTGTLVGGITALFCMLNLMVVPHPTWFWMEVPIVLVLGWGIGNRLQN